MGNTCGKGGKKSSKVGNQNTHGSDKAGSLIHSDRSGDNNKVEKIGMQLFLP